MVHLIVNGVTQGDVEAIYDQDGYWLAEQTLINSGINTPKGVQQTLAGTNYYRADQLSDIVSKIDAAELTVYLDAPASTFGEKNIALKQQHSERFPAPAPLSAYLSYRLSALHSNQDGGLEYQISPTLNVNAQNFNFRSEHDYNTQQDQWRRLNTTLDYDRPDLMLRATLGDLSPRQAALGFNQAMAGIGISRVFSMQPDFDSAPSFQTQAAITQPSTAEVYLNGQRVNTIQLQPGMYQLSDLQYFSGLQNVELIIKDQYGGISHYTIPYYFDDSLLKAGLHEFNYNLGVQRNNGSFNDYAGLAYSAFHRVGLTDWWTLGAQASGNPTDRSYGLISNFKLGQYGVLGSVLSWSAHDTQERGHAQQVQYRYSNEQWSVYANAQRQSPSYWPAQNTLLSTEHIDWTANLGANWGHRDLGNIGLEYGRQKSPSPAQDFHRYTLNYSISPWKNAAFNAQIRRLNGPETKKWSGFVNLTLNFGPGQSLYGGVQYRNQQALHSATFSQSAPSGEGWGYSLSAQEQETGHDYTAWLERNLRHGQFNASLLQSQDGSRNINNWRATWQGALAYSHGQWAATRYIYDSFGLVETGLAEVGVTQNGALIGKTNEDGWLMLPDVSSFNYQQIGLVQNDIPIEYSVDRLQRDLLSGNRDGRRLAFKLKKIRAISGQILDHAGQPLANLLFSTEHDGERVLLSTSMDGHFYTEQLGSGEYVLEGNNCKALLSITPSDEPISELAAVRCTTATEQ